MKKRLISLVLISAAFFAVLAGCSNSSDESNTADSGADKEKLIIGIDDTFAPMGFRDENNEIVGFDID